MIWKARMIERLRNDYQLSILVLMGVLPILTLVPYGLYRFLKGDLTVAIVDGVVVLISLLGIRHAWQTGDTRSPGLVISVTVSVGAVLVVLELGMTGLFWVYVGILFNFFMVSPGRSLLITGLMLGAIALLGRARQGVFESDFQLMSFLITSVTASMLALIFAVRTRSQQMLFEQLATLDPLTGAGNRRALDAELRIAAAKHRRYDQRYGVLALDLDHFKRINDLHGHPAGDRVLVDLVERVRRSAREEDRLFRVGGEEFLLLLPNIEMDGMLSVARKLLAKVGDQPFEGVGQVTLSIGGVLLGDPKEWSTDIRRADSLLYQAKLRGRDRALIEDNELHR